ncbi:methyltransferase domain-containing protein [Paenibacillus spiritus]|uniref:Methyltransferase domain-containing protein n=1 Tax=Paenibacillus spiritus TaxID=2496557 RepID=A0A5J5G061_9BACL|nr:MULTISPECIES: MerR family transcriptional regulator [Paenibacillus]KAA8999733.1 methyltransferase domain-containing protein [Paenibacillus spiritus]
MKIQEAADLLGISARTIQFYEERGLVAPVKGMNVYREFEEEDIWRLQTIIALREAGLGVADVMDSLRSADGHDYEQVLYYLEIQRSALFSKRMEIRSMIESIERIIEIVKKEKRLPPDEVYILAEHSRRIRGQREWEDQWNYERRGAAADPRARGGATDYADYSDALDFTVRSLAPLPGERGIDIGCGTGNLAGKLMEVGAVMSGIDQSREMLKQCRQRFPRLETKLGNFLALPYPEGSFNFAASSFALHHLTDDQKGLAIEEMRRVLKPHGRICITDFMMDDLGDKELPREDGFYPSLGSLLERFEERGYMAKHRRVSEMIYIVYAVPFH